jgi:hypothetical protein
MAPRALTSCCICLALLAGASPPAGAARPLKAIYGPAALPDGSSAFPVYRRLGVQVLELSLRWNRVAPSRPDRAADPGDPAYRWPRSLTSAIEQAARYRISIALLVEGFPAWVNGGARG